MPKKTADHQAGAHGLPVMHPGGPALALIIALSLLLSVWGPLEALEGISDPERVRGQIIANCGAGWEKIMEKRLQELARENPNFVSYQEVVVRLSDGTVRKYDFLIHQEGDDYHGIENHYCPARIKQHTAGDLLGHDAVAGGRSQPGVGGRTG